jgi:HK97 family phage major capsid protein
MKGRDFAGIERVMRRSFTGMQNPLLRSMHMDDAPPAGGGDPPKEPPKLQSVQFGGRTYNLNESIAIKDPEHDLPGYLEAVRVQLHEQARHGTNSPEFHEALGRATADINTIVAGYQETLKDYRKALRTVPDAGDGEGGLKHGTLSAVELRYAPTTKDDLADKVVAPRLQGMSRAQFNMVTRTVDDLGIDQPVARRKVARFQQLHDVLTLKQEWMARKNPAALHRGGWEAMDEAPEYKALSLEIGQELHRVRAAGPAMNETNADEGKNWVPGATLSARILPMIEEEVVLLSAFETVPMPGLTYDMGVLGSHIVSHKLNENILDDGTSAGAKMTPDYFKTKKFTFTAKLHAAAAVASPSWLQDAIVQGDAIIQALAYAIARGREKWMLNGQLTAALDGVAIASDDIRKMGDGIRYWYSQMKAAGLLADVDMAAGITSDSLVKMFGQQGSYGNRARRSIFVANTYAYAQLLVLKGSNGADVVQTFGANGDRSTFRTGSIGQAFNRDIFTTNDLSQTMDANGIDQAAPSDRTVLLHVFTDAIKHGTRLGISIEMTNAYRFLEYQDVFRAVARDDIARGYDPTTEPFISQGVGIRKVA